MLERRKYESYEADVMRGLVGVVAIFVVFFLLLYGLLYLSDNFPIRNLISPVWIIISIIFFVGLMGVAQYALFRMAFLQREYVFRRDFKKAVWGAVIGFIFGILTSLHVDSLVGSIIISVGLFFFLTFLSFGFWSYPEMNRTDNARKHIMDKYHSNGAKIKNFEMILTRDETGKILSSQVAFAKYEINGIKVCKKCLTVCDLDERNCWRCGNNFMEDKDIAARPYAPL